MGFVSNAEAAHDQTACHIYSAELLRAEVEWCVAELPEGGPAMRPADEMEGPASDGETLARILSRRGSRCGQGNEAVRGAPATFGNPAEVRHYHQAKDHRIAGKVIPAGRLRSCSTTCPARRGST